MTMTSHDKTRNFTALASFEPYGRKFKAFRGLLAIRFPQSWIHCNVGEKFYIGEKKSLCESSCIYRCICLKPKTSTYSFTRTFVMH